MRPGARSDPRAGVSTGIALAGFGAVLLAVALGLVVAYMVTSGPSEALAEAGVTEEMQDETSQYEYVVFGSVVANLAAGRLTRYLQVSITLEVEKESAAEVRDQIEQGGKAVFKNWLITYLSDKRLDEVEGAAAITRLRREIQDGFNSILAQSGSHRVEAVLFEEFNIQ